MIRIFYILVPCVCIAGLFLSLVSTGCAWTKTRDGKQGVIVAPFYFYTAAVVLFYITH